MRFANVPDSAGRGAWGSSASGVSLLVKGVRVLGCQVSVWQFGVKRCPDDIFSIQIIDLAKPFVDPSK